MDRIAWSTGNMIGAEITRPIVVRRQIALRLVSFLMKRQMAISASNGASQIAMNALTKNVTPRATVAAVKRPRAAK